MGLFDFLNKKNKDILTDNGINYIHENDGKGKLLKKFNKVDGVLHGEYIEYYKGKVFSVDEYINGKKVLTGKEKERYDTSIAILELHYKFFKELIEVDALFSKLSSIDLILRMQKKTLSEYACLLNDKFLGKVNSELIEVYLFFKRNKSIDSILAVELEPQTYYDNAFTEFLISMKKGVDFKLKSDEIYRPSRRHINYSFSYGFTLSREIRSYVGITLDNYSDLTNERFIPENFIRELLWDDSPLYGLKPDLLSEIRSIIDQYYDYPSDLDVKNEKLHLEIWESLDSIIFSEKEKQDGELLNIISAYVKENDKKTEFSFIEDNNWNELNVLKNDEKLGLNPNYNGVDESIGNIPSFEFKIIESVDHNQIDLNWLNITGPIYFDDGDTSLEFDALYTDDSLSIFINVQSIEKAKSIIDNIINLNGGKINFKQETVEEYKLFYTGNIFSIRFRETFAGIFQVDIISNEVLNK